MSANFLLGLRTLPTKPFIRLCLFEAVAAGHTVVEDLLLLEKEFRDDWAVEREPQDTSPALSEKYFVQEYCIIA